MPRRRQTIPLDALPLFASDADIAAAIVGPARAAEWLRDVLPILEREPTFPRINRLHRGRYTPAVRMFYDARAGLIDREKALRLVPDGEEGPWISRRSRTPRG